MNKEIQRLKTNFDLITYLDEQGVQWWEEGDNVTDGWINVNCFYCSDNKNHLGINLENKQFHCWACNETGDIVDLVRQLEDCSFYKAKSILEQHQDFQLKNNSKEKVEKKKYKKLLPEWFEPLWKGGEPIVVKNYMRRRNFPLSICQQWALGYVPRGEYALRLIVPVFHNNDIVSFQAVDATGDAVQKYLDCPPDRARIPSKHMVHGVDRANEKGKAVLVEGVTDQWRMGPGACCLMGKNYTPEQLSYLKENLNREVEVIVVLDKDAWKKAKVFAKELSMWWRVKVVELDRDDPDKLSEKEVDTIWAL